MSSTLTVYAIPFERLQRVPGSRDRGLVEAVSAESRGFLAQIDALGDGDEERPRCRDALAQIVEGAALSPHLGYLYGYALEALCAYLGRELPNVSGISGASAWVEKADELLRGRGAPVGLTDLVYGVCPVEIPEPDDYPYIGAWPPHVIPAALGAVRCVDPQGLGYELRETVARVRAWLEAAGSGEGLVRFLS
jgi:hypothetical protein